MIPLAERLEILAAHYATVARETETADLCLYAKGQAAAYSHAAALVLEVDLGRSPRVLRRASVLGDVELLGRRLGQLHEQLAP